MGHIPQHGEPWRGQKLARFHEKHVGKEISALQETSEPTITREEFRKFVPDCLTCCTLFQMAGSHGRQQAKSSLTEDFASNLFGCYQGVAEHGRSTVQPRDIWFRRAFAHRMSPVVHGVLQMDLAECRDRMVELEPTAHGV